MRTIDEPHMKSIQQKHIGFVSIEIALVLIISAIIGFVLIQQQARAAKKEVARVQADQLQQLADALNSYTDLYRRDLVVSGNLNIDIDNNGTTDVTIPETAPGGTAPEGGKLTPTVQNLIDAGLLPPGFLNRPAASNGQFVARLSIQPAGCSPSADNCRVEGYVTITQPVTTGGQNPAAGQFDGDVVGDMLGFMGGNGFATLAANQVAVSSGGNFTVALDLSGDGNPDANTNAGLVGVRVGATATRVDVRDPIPGVDFCRGNVPLFWPITGNSLPASPTIANACYAVVYSDTPVGYRFVQTDSNTGGGAGPGGAVLARCVFNEAANPPAQIQVLTTCCENGNSACTPPLPAGESLGSTSTSSGGSTTSSSSTSSTTTTTTSGGTNGNGGSNGNNR